VRARAAALAVLVTVSSAVVGGHDGPPFPILSDGAAGPYVVSIWTDPDTTDDGSPGGQFWVRLNVPRASELPQGTRATVTIRPVSRDGAELSRAAEPVRGDATNQFAALVMDHEGRFAVRVTIEGPLGQASVEAEVDATYDTRPAAILLLVYLLPFVAVGLLWGRLLMRRRTERAPPQQA
jgi:hypothetical protein